MSDIDAAERLLNLIIALTHTRVRMTRSEIRASVAGYDQANSSGSVEDQKKADAAFERKFERDKDDLRRMGIPLRTVTDLAHGDDIGYKIDATDAAMPPIELTAAELSVLAVAAEYWQDATLGADARQAVTKVSSTSRDIADAAMPLAGRASGSHPAVAALADAIHDRQRVTFTYSSATAGAADAAMRTVEPWQIVLRGGAAYLVGHDLDRGATRTFRIARIQGAVATEGSVGAFERPAGAAQHSLENTAVSGLATVGVIAEAGHSIRARGTFQRSTGHWDVFSVPYRTLDELRDEVLALAGSARVFEPAELAQAVVAHAKAALEVSNG